MTTTVDTEADIELAPSFFADEKEWLKQFGLEGLAGDLVEWGSVELDQTTSLLAVGDGCRSSLAAEDLDALHQKGQTDPLKFPFNHIGRINSEKVKHFLV